MTTRIQKHQAACEAVPEEHAEKLCRACCHADSHLFDEARAAGLGWSQILSLMLQFGPQFAAVLEALLASLKPKPAPTPA